MELTEETIEDIQDIYALLSKENGLSSEDLGKALRMLDLTPSESEIKDYQSKLNSDIVDYEEFLAIYKSCKTSPEIDIDEVKSQLDKLEKTEAGKVNAKDLKELLSNGEEPLDKLEIEELLQDFEKDGFVNIEEFFLAITGKA